MKKLLILILCVIPLNSAYSQANDAEAALYNVGLGGLSGAIGAVINKKSDEKVGKVFLKGLWQGALGGYVTFESKRILRLAGEEEDWKLYWTSNLVNAAGSSMKENAANNRDFWEQWNLSVGFNRIEFHTKDAFSIRYKVMPITAVYTLDAFFRYKLDASNSLKSGHLVFEQNNPEINFLVTTLPGYIVYNKSKMDASVRSYDQTLVHEIVHLYQANDYIIFNSFYSRKFESLFKNSKIMENVNEHIYYDLHFIPLRILYRLEYYKAESYYDNYFEHEAGYYGKTLF